MGPLRRPDEVEVVAAADAASCLSFCRPIRYASSPIAAGANAKAIAVFMGHSSINVTFDLYGHLMPGTEAEIASMLSGYLVAQIRAVD